MSTEIPEPASPESPLSLSQVFDALTPPGTDGAALLKALKESQRPVIPLPRPENLCDEGNTGCYVPLDGPPPLPARPSFPADPFTRGAEASAALREFYLDLLGADFTEDEATSIIGKMLSAHARESSAEAR